jgi:FixJ family two-component response regulator
MLRERGKVKAKRTLFMSGHAEKHIVRHGVLVEGVAFIGKPFTTEALAQKIRELLDDSPDPKHPA